MDFNEEPQSFTYSEGVSITIAKEHGFFRRAVPCMPMALAGLCCFLNILLPGSGTFLSSFSIFCCASYESERSKCHVFWTNILAAILQFLLFPVVVGCVWSIVWGVTFVQLAHAQELEYEIRMRRHQNDSNISLQISALQCD
uniref:Protein stum homolog n=1 Tax=Steinernema glaseri TaxID=37863 RepID=A0A1I7ZS74_9BILA